jgi:hypothetical protein
VDEDTTGAGSGCTVGAEFVFLLLEPELFLLDDEPGVVVVVGVVVLGVVVVLLVVCFFAEPALALFLPAELDFFFEPACLAGLFVTASVVVDGVDVVEPPVAAAVELLALVFELLPHALTHSASATSGRAAKRVDREDKMCTSFPCKETVHLY